MGNGDAYTQYQGKQNSQMIDLQFDMTDRAQQLSLDSAESNYFTAQIAASLMAPAAPLTGVVEKITVTPGQVVAAGQVIATIRAKNPSTVQLKLSVGESIISSLDPLGTNYLEYQNQLYPVTLLYLPTVPTSGNSYDLIFTLDEAIAQTLPHGVYLPFKLALKHQANNLLVPLNAIHQTQTGNYAYTLTYDDTLTPIAHQKTLTLGQVIGDFVTVLSGIEATESIILDNQLLDGQTVQLAP
jgi:multidrug efflux pump subunit AcrA (membrane-fusion protein)